MKELKIGDLVKIDDEYRSAMAEITTVMGTETARATVTYVENYTEYKNGIALVVDIISNKEFYEYDVYDIFKIILNSEVRYLYREHVQHAKRVS